MEGEDAVVGWWVWRDWEGVGGVPEPNVARLARWNLERLLLEAEQMRRVGAQVEHRWV